MIFFPWEDEDRHQMQLRIDELVNSKVELQVCGGGGFVSPKILGYVDRYSFAFLCRWRLGG